MTVAARKKAVYADLDPDPTAQTLEVQRWSDSGYVIVASHRGDAVVRAEPFAAVPLALPALWET